MKICDVCGNKEEIRSMNILFMGIPLTNVSLDLCEECMAIFHKAFSKDSILSHIARYKGVSLKRKGK